MSIILPSAWITTVARGTERKGLAEENLVPLVIARTETVDTENARAIERARPTLSSSLA